MCVCVCVCVCVYVCNNLQKYEQTYSFILDVENNCKKKGNKYYYEF